MMNEQMTKEEYAACKAAIMRGVYRRYWVRRVFQPFTLQMTALAVVFGIASVSVSLKSIVHNAQLHGGNPGQLSQFFIAAFLNTEAVVKVVCVLALVTATICFFDFARRFKRLFTFRPIRSLWGRAA